MSWFETKIHLIATAGREILLDPESDRLDREHVAIDIAKAAGAVLEREDPGAFVLAREILALLPLARKSVDEPMRQKLDQIQEILLEMILIGQKKHPSP